MRTIRRHITWALVAYVFLAGWVGYSFNLERQHSNANRIRAVNGAAIALKANCDNGNDLRVILQGIIKSSISQIPQYVKNGTLTPAQAATQIKLSQDAIAKLRIVDCKARIAPLTAQVK